MTAGHLRVRALDLETGRASRGIGRVRWSPARSGASGPAAWDVREEGTWRSGPCRGAPFRGAYRWERTASGLVVSHLRGGTDAPVRLVRVVSFDHDPGGGRLVSEAPHSCGADLYRLRLRVRHGGMELRWTIDGPRKRMRLSLVYGTPMPEPILSWALADGGKTDLPCLIPASARGRRAPTGRTASRDDRRTSSR